MQELMRQLAEFWHYLVAAGQADPPRFVEFLMLSLAIALLLAWSVVDALAGLGAGWPFLILSLSYAIGSAVSALVREAILPSAQTYLNRSVAALLLLVSSYSLTDVIRYL